MNEDYIPIPDDLETIKAIKVNKHWIAGIQPGTVRVFKDHISFTVDWHGKERRFTQHLREINGFDQYGDGG